MHWAAVFIVAHVAGFVEFWRLCKTAPLVREDQLSTLGQDEYQQRNPIRV